MKITNKTDLSYEELGRIIDKVMDSQDTCYEGKVEHIAVGYRNSIVKIEIKYLESYCEWIFYR